ncbi:MAG: hypothetical protein JWL73_2372 [Actinomycetia bacterium]|nr:hypothetical protein [Actinomycetes bacterium]
MPHSWHFPTGPMLQQIYRVQPRSVLDIGAGFGKWGYLARDMLDFNLNRLTPGEWQVRIDGVDAFPYESPLLDWVYDSVFHVDIVEDPSVATDYDLVILGDVIEHFPKAAGERLLAEIVRRNRNVLVATPVEFFTQEIADNPFERHLSLWGPQDFLRHPADIDRVGGSWVALLGGKDHVHPLPPNQAASRIAMRALPILGRDMALSSFKKVAETGAKARLRLSGG